VKTQDLLLKNVTVTAKLLVLVGRICLREISAAPISRSARFQGAARRAAQKGYGHFIIDLSECVLMDSTFLGVLAGSD